MPRRSPIPALAATLGLFAASCDGGLPAPDPTADVAVTARTAPDVRPDAHFGRDLLFRQVEEAAPGPLDGEPIAEAAPALAHDVALWSFTTAAGRLADILPLENLALAALSASDVPPDLDPALSPAPATTGLSREAWRLELWQSPAGAAPASPTLLGVLLERSLTAEGPVLAPPGPSSGSAPGSSGPSSGSAPGSSGGGEASEAGLVLWLDDGSLLARPLGLDLARDPADGALVAGRTQLSYMATETHRLIGAPVVALASADPARRYLVCARENVSGLLCAFMSRDGEVESWSAVPGLGAHTPEALVRVDAGFLGLALGCREGAADCEVAAATSFHLDPDGLPPKKHALIQLGGVASHRPIHAIATGEGLLVAARKGRLDALALWHLTPGRATPRDDKVGRLLGGVHLVPDDGASGGEVWLLDASPLVMRQGFPVALPRLSRWSPTLGREKHVAWPPRILAALPGHRGPLPKARPGFLAFAHTPRADALTVTCLHFAPNGTASAPPEATPARARRRPKAR